MMKRLAFAFAAVSLALTGCGGTLCDDLEDVDKDFSDKVKACPSLSDGSTYTEPTDAEREQCKKSLESCTDADKASIEKFIDCVNGLPACTAATEQQFTQSFTACALGNLANISAACLEVTSESIRDAASYSIAR